MSKKRKLVQPTTKKPRGPARGPRKPQPQQSKKSGSGSAKSAKSATPTTNATPATPATPEPTIPFDADEDSILLVGEGDLSFAASLVAHHAVADLTATVLEPSRAAVLDKYPHAAANMAAVEDAGGTVLFGVDATTMAFKGRQFSRILFNFPHVGGKSTDVNRQVRYNQELLVAFFGRARQALRHGGSIVVTLFEGEPYTLWNVRDLGRHAGLAVARSFRFQFGAYPGYHHARTLGVVRRADSTEASATAWKGEDRAARSYVFVPKDEAPTAPKAGEGKKARAGTKRARDDSSDSDE